MDAAGRYVPGYAVWTGVGESLVDARFRSCPIAQIEGGVTPAVLKTHRRLQIDGLRLADLVTAPTAALLDGLEVVDSERLAIRLKRAEDKAREPRTKRGK